MAQSVVNPHDEDESTGSISAFFALVRNQQDPDASKEIWKRYLPRMIGLARSILASNRVTLDPQDAVQESFLHFFRSVESGLFPNARNRDDLWAILSMLTVQRTRKGISREMAQKRGNGRVYLESQLRRAGSGSFAIDEYFPGISMAQWDLHCAEMLESLGEDLKEVALMRLAGHTNVEIQKLLGCSLRSVERRLQIIRVTWREQIAKES